MNPNMIQGPDGLSFYTCRWPASHPSRRKGSVVLVHGIGEHIMRYDHVAEMLNILGYDVFGYDQRGFGRSEGKRSFIPRTDTLLHDLQWMFERYTREVQQQHPGEVPFVIGHSMGGCVVAAACMERRIRPRGMVLCSPGLVPKTSPFMRCLAFLLNAVVPGLQLSNGLPMNRISHDKEVLRASANDPLNHQLITPRLAVFMFRYGAMAIKTAGECHIPTLLLVAGDDCFVKPEGAFALYKRLPEGVGTLHFYKELYHELFNERPEDRKQVFGDLAAWLQQTG